METKHKRSAPARRASMDLGRRLIAVVAALVVAVAAAGCGRSEEPQRAEARTDGPLRIAIVSPRQAYTTGSTVAVLVRLQGAGSTAAPVLRYSVDGGRYDLPRHVVAEGRPQATVVRGRLTRTRRPALVYRGLPKGAHTLTVTSGAARAQVRFKVS